MPESTSSGRRLRVSPSLVISIFALVIAMSTGAYAAVTIAPKNSVISKSIKNGNVKGRDLANQAVSSGKIKDNAVTGGKVQDGSLSGADIADGTVGSADITDNSITSADIGDGQIGASDFSPTALSNYYTKADADARYAPIPGVMRGTYMVLNDNSASFAAGSISWPYALSAPPTVNVLPTGSTGTPACPGTLANPQATPGNLCIYQRFVPGLSLTVTNASLGTGASPFGVFLLASRTGAGYIEASGSWAVRPLALASNSAQFGAGASKSGPAKQ